MDNRVTAACAALTPFVLGAETGTQTEVMIPYHSFECPEAEGGNYQKKGQSVVTERQLKVQLG